MAKIGDKQHFGQAIEMEILFCAAKRGQKDCNGKRGAEKWRLPVRGVFSAWPQEKNL
ncbi:hypothetical protein L0B70_07345 [Kaistella sp. 97-N-M2]|uniref:hypothetical protein n=1 Tax=Kaistella sp. 97-N-M2 TaxID=2908645 RepID=UPI001F3A2253|nr:hypothetical protein [Kaistella sp. 97-N-M2]UJF28690.1 hypothetical protein L0B70_07345 [Kaistella sp. 97-N-M2]